MIVLIPDVRPRSVNAATIRSFGSVPPVHEVRRAVAVTAPEPLHTCSVAGKCSSHLAFETFCGGGAHGVIYNKPGIREQVIDMPLWLAVSFETEVAFEAHKATGAKC